MPEQPPAELTATLERLGLATAAQVAKMRRRVGRLARDLPQFESVWVDALSQARVLTPYQAAELNAGRGQSLRVGPYLLCERLAHPCYVESYRAKNVESQEPVRLAIVDGDSSADAVLDSLNVLAAAAGSSSPPGAISHGGLENGRVFAAAPWVEGRTAAEWMVHHGRFPPEVVLEIARAMLGELVELEKARICHGDVSTSSLVLSDAGGVTLVLPGLRPVLRPEEGFAHADLRPEAYDSLAPERVSAGTRPGVRSDIYACGCVWWHLLCGRPPLIGGNSLAKLRAAQTGEIPDVRRYAPDVPQVLAPAISACLEHEPSRRPESMARLADVLGPPTRGGKDLLIDCLSRAGRPTVRWTTTVRSIRRSNRTPLWIAGAVCCLATVVAVLWPAWHGRATVEPPREAVAAKGEGRNEKGVTPGRGGAVVPTNRIAGTANLQTQNQKTLPPALAENHDGRVVGAAYQQVETKPADLVLNGDKPQVVGSLALRAGQNGSRAVGPTSHRPGPCGRPDRRAGGRPVRKHRLRLAAGRRWRRQCNGTGHRAVACRPGRVLRLLVPVRRDHGGDLARPCGSLGASGQARRDRHGASERPDPMDRLRAPQRGGGRRLPNDRRTGHRVEERIARRFRAVGAA